MLGRVVQRFLSDAIQGLFRGLRQIGLAIDLQAHMQAVTGLYRSRLLLERADQAFALE
jgi:hypothetical protein